MYKSLEEQIIELWKSRGFEKITIRFQIGAKTPTGDILEWIIHAKEPKKEG